MNFGCEILSEFQAINCLTVGKLSLFLRDHLGYEFYWLISIILFFAIFYFGFRKERKEDPFIISILVSFLIIWGRIPYWSLPELNPDEGFSISAALALQRDPVYWRSIIGGTHGPLLHYVLLIPSWFGFAIDFASLRAVGAVLIVIGVCSAFYASSLLFGKNAAVSGVIPIALFLGFNPFYDFQAYNGEIMISSIIGILMYVVCRIDKKPPAHPHLVFVIFGLLLGLMPLVKFQGIPICLVIGIAGLYVAWKKYPPKKAASLFTIQLLASLVPLSTAYLAARYFDVSDELLNSSFYFLFYYMDRTHIDLLTKLISFLQSIDLLNPTQFLLWNPILLSIIILIALLIRFPKIVTENRFSAALVMSTLMSTLFCVVRPGIIFTHYYMMLPVILLLLISMCGNFLFSATRRLPLTSALKIQKIYMIVVVFGVYVVAPVSAFIPITKQLFPSSNLKQHAISWDDTLKAVSAVTDQNDSMVVWGWADLWYARTGIPPAIKYPDIYLAVEESPLREIFAKNYFTLISEKLPPVMIEAVGKGYFVYVNPSQFGIEKYPPLKKILSEHYTLWGEERETKIYVRHDRLQQIYNFTDSVDLTSSLFEKTLIESDKLSLHKILEDLRRTPSEITFRKLDEAIENTIRVDESQRAAFTRLRGAILLALRQHKSPECIVSFAQCG